MLVFENTFSKLKNNWPFRFRHSICSLFRVSLNTVRGIGSLKPALSDWKLGCSSSAKLSPETFKMFKVAMKKPKFVSRSFGDSPSKILYSELVNKCAKCSNKILRRSARLKFSMVKDNCFSSAFWRSREVTVLNSSLQFVPSSSFEVWKINFLTVSGTDRAFTDTQ